MSFELEEVARRARCSSAAISANPHQPIIRDPEALVETDYLVMESTYGDRLHRNDGGDPKDELAAILEEARRSGGNVIIPAFAVGRTQELIYFLREIMDERGLHMPIYVDSPLASKATEVFRSHPEVFDEEARKVVQEPGGIFDFPQLHYTSSVEEYRELNDKKGVVIISASGMADAGRIRHHLKHNLWRPEAHIVIVGFMAQGTMGRRLLDGAKEVRLFGEDVAVRAQVHDIHGLSAHADQGQLLDWASNFKRPKLVVLTHGEPESALAFKKLLEDELDFKVVVPARGQIIELDGKTAKE